MADPTCQAPSPPASSGGAERRKHVRYPLGPSVCGYVVDGTEIVIPEQMGNVSAGGIRLVLDRPLQPNAVAVVDLYNVAHNFPCREAIRVVYLKQQPDGRFIVGGAFIRTLGSMEIQELV